MIADYHWVDLGLRRNLQETTLSLLWSPEFGRNIWISGFPWVSCKSSLNKPTSERLGSLSQVFVGGFKHQLKGLCLRSCRIQECGNLYFYGPIVCPKKFSCADTDKLFDISMLPSIRNQHDLASFFSKVLYIEWLSIWVCLKMVYPILPQFQCIVIMWPFQLSNSLRVCYVYTYECFLKLGDPQIIQN